MEGNCEEDVFGHGGALDNREDAATRTQYHDAEPRRDPTTCGGASAATAAVEERRKRPASGEHEHDEEDLGCWEVAAAARSEAAARRIQAIRERVRAKEAAAARRGDSGPSQEGGGGADGGPLAVDDGSIETAADKESRRWRKRDRDSGSEECGGVSLSSTENADRRLRGRHAVEETRGHGRG